MRQLSDPQPADRTVIDQLSSYRRLRRRWSDWSAVTEVLGAVAARMVSSMTPLAFRNVDASPDDPVSEWPQEAIQTALERGGLPIGAGWPGDPGGALGPGRPPGRGDALLQPSLRRREDDGASDPNGREEAEKSEREAVAAEIDGLVRASGLSRADFASRIGTSASRLSTYVTGKVTPSAALLVRMRHVARRERGGRELLAMPPPPGDGPEPDWEDQKQELRDAQSSRWPGA